MLLILGHFFGNFFINYLTWIYYYTIFVLLISAFKYVKISSKESTSDIFGTLLISTISSHSIAAGINATTLFLSLKCLLFPTIYVPLLFWFLAFYSSTLYFIVFFNGVLVNDNNCFYILFTHYFSIYKNPNMKSTIPPNMVDIFPYFLFNVSPKFNPKYVNSILVMQNTVDEKCNFWLLMIILFLLLNYLYLQIIRILNS